MERLTLPISEKPYIVYGMPGYINRYLPKPETSISKLCDKVGMLEDIEDRYNISLPIFFDAIENGIYCKNKNGDIDYYCIFFNNIDSYDDGKRYVYFFLINDEEYYFEDFGKTWGFTREELL